MPWTQEIIREGAQQLDVVGWQGQGGRGERWQPAVEERTSSTCWPPSVSCRAISNATTPPIDQPREQIGTLWLHLAHGLEVGLRHVLEGREGLADAVEPPRLQAVQRLIRAQLTRELGVAQEGASDGMDAEQRPAGALGLDGHERCPVRGALLLAEQRGEALDRGVGEECGQGQPPAQALLDPGHEADGQQGVAAQLEEVVVDAHVLHAQHLAPRGVASCSSSSSRGGAKDSAELADTPSGAGRAFLSTLPLGVSGTFSSFTKAEGTMCSGSFCFRCSRSSEASGACPSCATQYATSRLLPGTSSLTTTTA